MTARQWWQMSRVDLVGAALGMGVGLVAAGPLMWLAEEARRAGNTDLTPAGRFASWQLLAVWGGGSLVGSFVAAVLARALIRPGAAARGLAVAAHLLAGSIVVGVLAPVLPALLLGLREGSLRLAWECYTVAGGFVGWQSGLIAFVFLYTFRWLEQVRRAREARS